MSVFCTPITCKALQESDHEAPGTASCKWQVISSEGSTVIVKKMLKKHGLAVVAAVLRAEHEKVTS